MTVVPPRGFADSAAMQTALRGLERAIAGEGGVLLYGEVGTDLELFARAIHLGGYGHCKGSVKQLLRTCMRGVRSVRPFVVVDCAGGQDLEQQLFGCASSAVDAASEGVDRIAEGSALHRAMSGTLVLFHLAEMPGRLQARLARLLRDREVRLATKDIEAHTQTVELRPIATLDAMSGDDRVHPDLRNRLSETTIEIPPLRERREDIPALARYFLVEICASLKLPPKTPSAQASVLLAALPWRGNLTELRSLLHGLVLKVPGRLIRVADVLMHVRLDGGPATFACGGSLRQACKRFEREYVASVLAQHHGRMAEAAKALGIQRTNLYRKVRQLSVTRTTPGRRTL